MARAKFPLILKPSGMSKPKVKNTRSRVHTRVKNIGMMNKMTRQHRKKLHSY